MPSKSLETDCYSHVTDAVSTAIYANVIGKGEDRKVPQA